MLMKYQLVRLLMGFALKNKNRKLNSPSSGKSIASMLVLGSLPWLILHDFLILIFFLKTLWIIKKSDGFSFIQYKTT